MLWLSLATAHGLRLKAGALAGVLPTLPAAVSAASVSYDFSYRMGRALDPDQRGPADDSAGGFDALMGMCDPPPEAPDADDPAASQIVADSVRSIVSAEPAVADPSVPGGLVGGVSAAAAAALATPEPATSAEPLIALAQAVSGGIW